MLHSTVLVAASICYILKEFSELTHRRHEGSPSQAFNYKWFKLFIKKKSISQVKESPEMRQYQMDIFVSEEWHILDLYVSTNHLF